jgi:Protein of unknown function (DUF3303)
MVIERFKNGDAAPVYKRFAERGRMAPPEVTYVNSWVTSDLTTCFQVMEAPHRMALDAWIANWTDLVDFEVHEVVSSADAAARVRR